MKGVPNTCGPASLHYNKFSKLLSLTIPDTFSLCITIVEKVPDLRNSTKLRINVGNGRLGGSGDKMNIT